MTDIDKEERKLGAVGQQEAAGGGIGRRSAIAGLALGATGVASIAAANAQPAGGKAISHGGGVVVELNRKFSPASIQRTITDFRNAFPNASNYRFGGWAKSLVPDQTKWRNPTDAARDNYGMWDGDVGAVLMSNPRVNDLITVNIRENLAPGGAGLPMHFAVGRSGDGQYHVHVGPGVDENGVVYKVIAIDCPV